MNQQQIDRLQQSWIEKHVIGRALQIGCGMKPIAGAVNLDPNPDRRQYVDIAGDALLLPFQDGAFDSVVSSHVVPHLHNPAQALREMARVLSPGGVMAHVIPDLRYAPRRRSDRYPFADQPFGWCGPDDFRPVMDDLSDVLCVVTLENFAEFNWSFKMVAVVLP